jgi:hypothetical protein
MTTETVATHGVASAANKIVTFYDYDNFLRDYPETFRIFVAKRSG